MKVRTENVHALHRRLDRLTDENHRLKSAIRNQKAVLKSKDRLVVSVTEALQLAALAADPRTSKPLEDNGPRSAETPLPGDHVKGARRAERKLRAQIESALDSFQRAADHDWYPPKLPHPDDNIPSVRCCQRDCPAVDVTEKAWRVIRGGRVVYRERCGSCGSIMVAAHNPQQQQLHGVS